MCLICFTDHTRAAAHYGAILEQLGDTEHPEDTMVEEAMHIDSTVDNAVQTHSINPGRIEAEIRKALLCLYHAPNM